MQDNGGCAELQGRSPMANHPNILRPDKPTLPPLKPEDLSVLAKELMSQKHLKGVSTAVAVG